MHGESECIDSPCNRDGSGPRASPESRACRKASSLQPPSDGKTQTEMLAINIYDEQIFVAHAIRWRDWNGKMAGGIEIGSIRK